MYYVGLNVHKNTIGYCVKDVRGSIQSESSLSAARSDLDRWLKAFPSGGRRQWKPQNLGANK